MSQKKKLFECFFLLEMKIHMNKNPFTKAIFLVRFQFVFSKCFFPLFIPSVTVIGRLAAGKQNPPLLLLLCFPRKRDQHSFHGCLVVGQSAFFSPHSLGCSKQKGLFSLHCACMCLQYIASIDTLWLEMRGKATVTYEGRFFYGTNDFILSATNDMYK